MAPDIDNLPDVLPQRDAGRYWGVPIAKSTLRSWHYQGIRSKLGSRIKLRMIRVGAALYVRRKDAEAFQEAVNRDRGDPVQVGPTAEQRRRQKQALDDAHQVLREAGIM